ncbi:MAG: fucose isomerase [Oscillospiraceae bacterium]|nr:fucose isomerase [Oscillospiraceae bacterium]
MITKSNDVKLNVLPLLVTCEHLAYYEGPCRFGQGEALQPGFDRLANAQKATVFMEALRECAPAGVEILAPISIGRTDDWDNKEAQWTVAASAMQSVDLVVVMSGIACDDLVVEFAERFCKPIAVPTVNGFSASTVTAALRAKAMSKYEVYAFYQWSDLGFTMKTLRARKVIRTTHILCVSRFGSTTSYSSVDAFNSFDLITKRLGARFRFVNLHEFFDCMSPARDEGNYTTPGRKTPNLTAEDMAMASAIADELSAGAVENTMTKEMMLPSIIMYITAQKYMDLNDCNGFTIPCPDACSTRRMNAEKFTPCLTHALNMEQGIPSACEYDTNAVLSQQALIAVSGKNPYMGNTVPIPCVDGHFQTRFANTPEQFAELEKDPANLGHLYMMQHSVAHRRLRDSDKNAEYSIRNFTYDQGFGVTIRYDFDADAGQKITFCRFAPDGSKLFIGTGEIVMGGGYKSQNCTQLVYFRVKDTADTWEKQCYAGNHCAMVYGDYTKELIALAKSLGVEALVAD